MTEQVRRILVTGSRDWTNKLWVRSALIHAADGKRIIVVHGGARGLDVLAAEVATSLGFELEPHPADWGKHGKAAGPIRNQEMVDLGAEVCLAFPLGESRGTRDCMSRAGKAGIPVINYGDPE